MKSKIIKPKNSHSATHLTSTQQQIEEARITINQSQQQVQNEELFDIFMENSLVLPLNEAFEPQVKQMYHSEKCVLWIDHPEQQLLYSPTFSITAGYKNSIPGFILKTKNVIQIKDPNQAPGGYLSDPKVASPNSPQLFFPISTLGTVRGVVQIVKRQGTNGFTETDMQTTSHIMKKFSIYGDSLFTSRSLSQIALSLYSGGTSSTKHANPLELIQKHFHCQKVELFHFDTSRMIGQIYDAALHAMIPVDTDDFGLVGFSVSSQTTINAKEAKSENHFSEVFDGKIDGPVLIVSAMFGRRDAWTVALRRRQQMFSTADESQLAALLPFIVRSISGFSSSEEQSAFNAQLSELIDVAAALTAMPTSKKIVSTPKNTDSINLSVISTEFLEISEIGQIITEKAASIMQCEKVILYLVDKKKNEICEISKDGNKRTFPIGNGITGKVIKEKSAINLSDPAFDDQFSSEIDSLPGYSPKSLLAAPVFSNNEVCAVVLLLTKIDSESFDGNDMKILKAFSVFAGICLHDSSLYQMSIKLSQKIRSYIDFTLQTNEESKLKPLLEDILSDFNVLIQSSRISLFLVDGEKLALFLNVGSKCSFGSTFSAKALQQRNSVNFSQNDIIKMKPKNQKQEIDVNSFENSPSICEIFENDNSYLTKPSQSKNKDGEKIVCIPLFNKEKAIIGVLEIYYSTSVKNEVDLLDSLSEIALLSFERIRMKELSAFGYGDLDLNDWIKENERKSDKIPEKFELDEVKSILTINFDSFKFDGIGQFKVVFYIFSYFDLMKTFEIDNELLFNFLVAIRRAYNQSSTPASHNFRRAINVLQFVAFEVNQCDLQNVLKKEDLLALFVASICYNVGYEFNCDSNSLNPFKILFKQQSVVETNSCSLAISILSKNECNLFRSFRNDDELAEIWKTFIRLILATDLTNHSDYFDEFNNLVSRGELDFSEKKEHKMLLLIFLIKCADLSALVRPFALDEDEINDLCDKFILHADNIDENSNKLETFCNTICIPLFDLMGKALPKFKCNEQIKSKIESFNKTVKNI